MTDQHPRRVRLTHQDLDDLGRAVTTRDRFVIVDPGGPLARTVEKILNERLAAAEEEAARPVIRHLPTENSGECSICFDAWPCPEANQPVIRPEEER